MQAVILAGGEGTRLRPLTSRVAKPVVTLVDRPFMAYMLEWLHRHGVDRRRALVRLPRATACATSSATARATGCALRYVEEPEPLGTGGALRHAGDLLDERFLVCNGDVLTDIDLGAQLAQHERTGARGDAGADRGRGSERLRPRALSMTTARCSSSSRSRDEVDARRQLVSAGAYVLERSVLDLIAPGRRGLARARGLAGAGRQRPLRLRRERLLARHRHPRALPAGRRFDIITGAVRTDGHAADGAARDRRRLRDRRRRPDRRARRARRPACASASGAAIDALGRARRRRDRRRAASSATASSPSVRRSGRTPSWRRGRGRRGRARRRAPAARRGRADRSRGSAR